MTGLLEEAHHDGSARYVSNPTPELGETVTVFVRVPAGAPVRRVHVRATPDAEPHFAEATVDRRTADGVTWWRAEVTVRNPVTRYRFLLDRPEGPRWLHAAGTSGHDVPDATDFRLVSYDPPPAWTRDAVVYQIFPDRFDRSAAAAGREPPEWAVPCDWDDPVVGRGPQTPFQYYGGDLDGVTERLGHLAGLGVNTVYLTPVFPARSTHRYDGAAFDRVDPLLGGEAALTRLAEAVHARGWRLLGDLTTNHCGETHPWFTAARWLRPPFGLDGWRVDVANMTGRAGPDDYTHEVAALLRAAVTAARPDAALLAEHGHDATGDLDRDGWHGTMNYAGFTRPVWSWLRGAELDLPDFLGVPGGVPRRDGPAVLATMRAFAGLMSWRSLTASWNLLGSHDTARIRTVVGSAAAGEVAAGLLFTLPGTPMLFAGDEFGLTGRWGEDSRTPMPWHRPQAWDRRTLRYYRDLAWLRRHSPALRDGGLQWLYVDPDTLVFVRESATEALLVSARRATGPPVRLPRTGPAVAVYGASDLDPEPDGAVTLPGDGPAFQVWRLPRR